MNDLQIWLVQRMAENGLSPNVIARKLGFAQPSVADWLKRNPVKKKVTFTCELCGNRYVSQSSRQNVMGWPWVFCALCAEGVRLRTPSSTISRTSKKRLPIPGFF